MPLRSRNFYILKLTLDYEVPLIWVLLFTLRHYRCYGFTFLTFPLIF